MKSVITELWYIVEKTTTELAKQRGIDENLKSTDPIC